MIQDELKKIASKIAKCLALTGSDNPGEAEAAKRQAEALMKKYNLTTDDVAASQVREEAADMKSRYKPPLYIAALSSIIADAFGCEVVCSVGFDHLFIKRNTVIRFIGVGVKPELAAYTFDVLRRLITKDRQNYTDSLRKNLKRATKIRRGDIFCEAWVSGIADQVHGFAGTDQEKAAIAAYKEAAFGGNLDADTRTNTSQKHSHDWKAEQAGYEASSNVSLHKPVQAKRGAMLE